MKLFGTDGIRGLAGQDLNVFQVLKIGIAAGIHFSKNKKNKTNKILIAKDTRISGYMIENALVSGLTAVGYQVIQVGPMPTPAISFLTEDMRCDAGLMITASHNQFYDNGIKFFNSSGEKIKEEDEKSIESIMENENLLMSSLKIKKDIGKSKRINDVRGRYIVNIKNSFPVNLSLVGKRVVVDCANGAAYKIAPVIFEELGAEVILLSSQPTGFNINLNCGATSTDVIAKKVIEVRADFGIALDGDSDRIVAIDELGNPIDGDNLIGAIALYLKENNKLMDNKVAVTIMSNGALDLYLKKKGIKVYRSQVGDKNLFKTMKENGINFGGEQSGHIICSNFSKTGDGLVSALQCLSHLIHSDKKASEAFNLFDLNAQEHHQISIKEKIDIDNKKEIIAIKKELETKNIRFVIRYSGTENILRILLEGSNKKIVKNMMKKVIEEYQKVLIV